MTAPDFKAILIEAHGAAVAAAAHLPDVGACGFAWVTVDGNEPIARWCRKQPKGSAWGTGRGFYGDKGYPKGWQWWSPGYGGQQSVRIGDWKGIRTNLNPRPKAKDQKAGEIELYDLSTDVAETKNVAADHPEIVAKIAAIMKEQHVPAKLWPMKALDK